MPYPKHPTFVYLSNLLHYAGYSSIISYLAALLIFRPLLENKSRLLKEYYGWNLQQLGKLYQQLIGKFVIAPSLLVTYGNKKYSDATTQTESVKYNYGAEDFNDNYSRDTYVTTSAKSVGKLQLLLDSLTIFDDKTSRPMLYNQVNTQLNEFNNELQEDRYGNGRLFDKNSMVDEINTKIRKLKGTVLSQE